MTGTHARLLRASLTNGKPVLSTGDKNLCHQQEPYIRWIWEDAKDNFYLAGFRTKEAALLYAEWQGWIKPKPLVIPSKQELANPSVEMIEGWLK